MQDPSAPDPSGAICPTAGCGARLPRAPAGSLSILRASFPDQVTEVGLLAAGGAEYVYCERCAQLVPYDSAAICILEPLQVALIYVPPSFTARYPDVRLALDRAFAPTAGDAGDIRRELLYDPREFRRRISRGIAGLALGTINDFTTVDGGSPHELQAWMHENGARLDRGFVPREPRR